MGGIRISAAVQNIASAAMTDAKLKVVLYEDLGTDEHHYVVRDILPPVTISGLQSGATQNFTLSSSYSGTTGNLNAVVFVQTPSGEILQAALAQK
jgi:hypothetical protein